MARLPQALWCSLPPISLCVCSQSLLTTLVPLGYQVVVAETFGQRRGAPQQKCRTSTYPPTTRRPESFLLVFRFSCSSLCLSPPNPCEQPMNVTPPTRAKYILVGKTRLLLWVCFGLFNGGGSRRFTTKIIPCGGNLRQNLQKPPTAYI